MRGSRDVRWPPCGLNVRCFGVSTLCFSENGLDYTVVIQGDQGLKDRGALWI